MSLKEDEQPIYLRLFRHLFPGKRKQNQNSRKAMKRDTPLQRFMGSFLNHKIAVVGLISFFILFLMVLIVPLRYPLNQSYQEVTQQNVSPGRSFLSVPKELQHNVSEISVGATFSVGKTKEGEILLWGNYSKAVYNLPVDLGRVTMISAGQNHVLAVNEEGKLYAWGSNRFGQLEIPEKVKQFHGIRQILAGNQYSMAVSTEGEVCFWGNGNLVHFDVSQWQGKIEHIAANNSVVIGLLRDGNVVLLSKRASTFSDIPKFHAKVIHIAMTVSDAYAIDEEGRLYRWGSQKNYLHTPEVPFVQIQAGRYHAAALDVKGKVTTFGENLYGEGEVPSKLEKEQIVELYSGYYQNYAVTEQGSILSWGFKGYLMGTDGYGRDIFVRLMNGGRWTMTIGAIAVVIQSVIGIIIGGFAGYCGGRIDNLLMRCAEVINSLPFLPFAMILSAMIGNKLTQMQRIYMIMVVLGILNWPGMARLVRAQILSEKSKEFVTAAKAMGIGQVSIIFRHILPNVLSYVIVSATGSFASSMLTESSLSFLGFGVVEPTPTWGNMLTAAQSSIVISTYWWRWFFPALALAIATISINMIGDGLREALDPKGSL